MRREGRRRRHLRATFDPLIYRREPTRAVRCPSPLRRRRRRVIGARERWRCAALGPEGRGWGGGRGVGRGILMEPCKHILTGRRSGRGRGGAGRAGPRRPRPLIASSE